jgi:hypothetical protein
MIEVRQTIHDNDGIAVIVHFSTQEEMETWLRWLLEGEPVKGDGHDGGGSDGKAPP